MSPRINRAIELLEQGQPIYYIGGHTGHVLTYDQGKKDAGTWADYINVGFEHGALDFAGLDEYMRGLIDGGPAASGHRMPAVVVEAPVNGIDEAHIRYAAWQFRVILGRGVHGVLLCQAESPDVVRAFVESCRYPNQLEGVDPGLPSAVDRMRGAGTRTASAAVATAGTTPSPAPDVGWHPRPGGHPAGRADVRGDGRPWLGRGTRGRGSEPTAAAVWGLSPEEYMGRCDPWPLNRRGELLLGVKLESPEGVANCDEILAVPGIGFAEMGPGDLGLALGYVKVPRDPYPQEMLEAREKIFAACRRNGVAFLEGATPENVARKIDEGVRVVAGHREDTAQAGRAYSKRTMPV